jgi:hypothetical protein
LYVQTMNETTARESLVDDDLARSLDIGPAWLDEGIEIDAIAGSRTDEVMMSCWVCRGTGNVVVDPHGRRAELWRCLGCRGRGWVVTVVRDP